MKIKVIPASWHFNEVLEWKVKLTQGHQSFTLEYRGNREECEWYARMFQKALDAYANELELEKRPSTQYPTPDRIDTIELDKWHVEGGTLWNKEEAKQMEDFLNGGEGI